MNPEETRRIAFYIKLTDVSWVKESQSPFEERARKKEKLKTLFRQTFRGEPTKELLQFRSEGNWYEMQR